MIIFFIWESVAGLSWSTVFGMAKTAFYAVANGRRIGVFRTWDECHILVDKFPHARYKKFSSEREAHDFINKYKITESPTSSGMEVKNSVYPQPSQSTKNHQQFNNKSVTTGEQLSTVARNSLDEIKNNNQINENRKRRHSTSVSLNSKFIKENDSVLWNGAPVVYTDGACSRNGRYGAKAGYGVFWGPNHVDNKYGPVNGAPTNNRGELQAVVVALNQAIEKKLSHIIIRTDSELLIKSVNYYMDNWKKNNWKTSIGGVVKNQDLLITIDRQMQHIKVKFDHVPAHCGIIGNEAADTLARQGARMYRSSTTN